MFLFCLRTKANSCHMWHERKHKQHTRTYSTSIKESQSKFEMKFKLIQIFFCLFNFEYARIFKEAALIYKSAFLQGLSKILKKSYSKNYVNSIMKNSSHEFQLKIYF